VLSPQEILVPGRVPVRAIGPDVLRFDLVFADGDRVSSLRPDDRWRQTSPESAVLVPLGVRTETSTANDRRAAEHRVVTARYWVWPIPAAGSVEVRVEWPAEVLHGVASFDARGMVAAAEELRASSR
jgi:hypothetical protein